MSRRGRGDPSDLTGNDREEARKRSLARRGSGVRGDSHSVTVCPECRAHIAHRTDYGDPPEECGDCGAVLRCGSCGGDLSEADRSEGTDLDEGYCPRCGDPVGPDEDSGPGSEEFTWKDK